MSDVKQKAIDELNELLALYDDRISDYLPGGAYEYEDPLSMIDMYEGDKARVRTIIKLIKAGNIEDAIGAARYQDTAAREYIPDIVFRLCPDCSAEGVQRGLGDIGMWTCPSCDGQGIRQGASRGNVWDESNPAYFPDE